jgi:excisionase family DNA binding protein
MLVNFNRHVEVPMSKLLHSIIATAGILDIGRSSVYRLIAEEKIKAVKIGRRTLITDESIRDCVLNLAADISVDRGAS